MRSQVVPEIIRSAGLSIHPSLGQIRMGSQCIALGPVNMKVLMVLLSQPGKVISRGDFYQQVWGNQIVSDDALTRCVSDLRSELGNLCTDKKLIETLPKRGYRWIPPIENDTFETVPESKYSVWVQYLFFSLISVLVIGVLSSATLSYLSKPTDIETVQIALIPADTEDSTLRDFAIELEDSLKYYLLSTPNLRFVSNGALSTLSSNYSFYARDLNVKWIVESDIKEKGNGIRVTLSLVDPYTSLVVHTDYADISNHPSEIRNFSIKFAADISKMLSDYTNH